MIKKLFIAVLLAACLIPAIPVSAQAIPAVYLSAATNNSTLIATGKRSVLYLNAINTTATLYYLRLYDLAGAPTCSSATGVVHNFPVPASTTGAGFALSLGMNGALFSSGLGFCITAGAANNDNTSAATGVVINIGYR